MHVQSVGNSNNVNNFQTVETLERRTGGGDPDAAYVALQSDNALFNTLNRNPTGDVTAAFKQEFAAAASDPAAFHALLQSSFGDSYDRTAAEELRQQALRGDFSWLPDVRFVDGETLQGANGAYDAASGTVLLNADLLGNTALLSRTYAEEVGHHLDTLLNGSDAVGDEGEIFRRLLFGEKLSATQLATIRAENDHGTIVVDGKELQVEFWGPLAGVGKWASKAADSAVDFVKDVGESAVDAVSDAGTAVADFVGGGVKAVSRGVAEVASRVYEALRVAWDTGSNWVSDVYDVVEDAVKATGNSVARAARQAWEALVEHARQLWDNVRFTAEALWTFGRDVVTNLAEGDFAGAWEACKTAFDDIVFKLPGRLMSDALDLLDGVVLATIELIPIAPVRDAMRDQAERLLESARTVVMGVHDTWVGISRNLFEAGGDIAEGLGKLAVLDPEGFSDIGNGLLKVVQTPVDAAVFLTAKAASAIQTSLHLEPPGRELTDAEVARLRPIFGDSIDYDQVRVKEGNAGVFSTNARPFVLGNTIYLKNDDDEGLLEHEMVHVWQHQNGGTDYMSEAVLADMKGGAYEWGPDVPQVPFGELGPEQQAEFIEDAAIEGAFTVTPPAFPPDYEPRAGVTLDELNAYLTEAVRLLRSGNGTP